MDTENAIRQAEQAKNSPETPATQEQDGSGGLPLPSLSRKHMAILGVLVAVAVAYYLYRRQDTASSGGANLDTAREQVDGSTQAAIEDEDDEDDEITVEHDPNNPLAADATVIKEFRQRGILSDEEEDA